MTADSEQHNRRMAYLHEAGHAVVAIQRGLIVRTLTSDGEGGYCKADLSDKANDRLQQIYAEARAGKIQGPEFAERAIEAFFDKLVTMVGGIAGESLMLGRPIYSTRRAADDLSTFSGI